MSADRSELKNKAEKFITAHHEMCRIGEGIGGLAIQRPDLLPDFHAWSDASDVDHADTVLTLIDGPEVINYVVIARDGKFIQEFGQDKTAAEDFARESTRDCRDMEIDWDYRVAEIVEARS